MFHFILKQFKDEIFLKQRFRFPTRSVCQEQSSSKRRRIEKESLKLKNYGEERSVFLRIFNSFVEERAPSMRRTGRPALRRYKTGVADTAHCC